MDITKNLTNKTSEKVTMQLDLKASTSGKETLSDHYGILRTLGKGNFAEVKLAYHLQTEEQVAIKVLQNGTNDDFSIQTELDILKTLDHPYIIKLFHIINTKEYTYMVLEHAAGGDLVSHIERVGSLQEEQAQHIFAQLVCAVHYCHENDIAHRDIKLDNMLLDDKGNIKLCDFGLATRVTPGQGTKGFCGTLEYCAPELFSDEEYDAMAADIWSMGVVLYAMVTSSFPFEGNTYSDMKEEMQDPKYHLPYKLSKNIANIIVQLFTVKPEQRPKIDDIRRHQWVKAKEEIWKITPSLEALCNNPNPSVVVDMCSMGYHPKDISACLHEKKFNNIMATYLILNHNSPRGHSKYTEKFLRASVAKSPADALTSIPSRRRLSELALPTLLEEHRVHDEKGSRKTTMRSLSMPATLCCQQKGNKRPPPAPKLARRKITYVKSRCLAVDSMICSWSSPRSLSSESISSAKCLSCEAPQDVNTPQNSSYTQSSGSYREIPCIVNTTATYDIQNSFEDAPPEGIPEIPTSSLQESSKNTFDDVPPEGIPEIQTSALQASSKNTFDDVPPEGIPEIQTSSHQASSKNIFEDVTPEDTTKIQRSYIQEISKNSFEDVTPEVITAASASRLSRGWKRVKKRTGNCLRRLCCCIPAGKRSHVSQKEAEPVEVESCAVAHMQLHGASKMHSCVS
ncbi:sperm motility kinase X-like [Mesocricetus auratus]|uniref:non-specific serine/threonine protein kinase n=1 Tax=Mesocricetus auratus TaxID=10036 RepID=A0A1U7QPB5_MESAU|nr:sperm motility kinase X-like [Mesocricetus auratus]